jgi:hypothetical protein
VRLSAGVTSLVLLAVVVGTVSPPTAATAGPSDTLCSMSTDRGEVPDRFAIEACVDGENIWLRNSLEVPVRFVTNGDAEQDVTSS